MCTEILVQSSGITRDKEVREGGWVISGLLFTSKKPRTRRQSDQPPSPKVNSSQEESLLCSWGSTSPIHCPHHGLSVQLWCGPHVLFSELGITPLLGRVPQYRPNMQESQNRERLRDQIRYLVFNMNISKLPRLRLRRFTGCETVHVCVTFCSPPLTPVPGARPVY